MARRKQQPEDGFVSIFTVLIIMSVLTLLAVGFSVVTRQAERRTLDSQLNTQAFYAAESGVNDARRAIEQDIGVDKTSCKGNASNGAAFNYMLDAGLGIEYTCLLIDTDPTWYENTDVPVMAGGSEPVVTQFSSAQIVPAFDFYWDSNEGGAPPVPGASFGMSGSNPIFPTLATWGNRVGVLKVDIVPTDGQGVTDPMSRTNLINHGYTFFLYPVSTGGQTAITVRNGTGDKAETLATTCTDATVVGYRCRARVNLETDYAAGNAPVSRSFFVRLQSLYRPVKVRFEALNAANQRQPLDGAQAVVDATGRANDVYRRIQVRLPLNPVPGMQQGYALLSNDSICKRITVNNTSIEYNGDNGAPIASGQACHNSL